MTALCAVRAAADAVCDAEKARSIAVRLEQELAAATELIGLLRARASCLSHGAYHTRQCAVGAALTEWDERYGETA